MGHGATATVGSPLPSSFAWYPVEGGKEDGYMSDSAERPRGAIASAISSGAVGLLHNYTGRGPTKARTILDRDSVTILLADTLTRGERTLADRGDTTIVLEMRHRFQMAMRGDLIAMVESEVDRKVLAFMSTNHIDPDMAVEVFVLEPSEEGESHDHDEVAGTSETA
jgi:uncharacterized protein YbcI